MIAAKAPEQKPSATEVVAPPTVELSPTAVNTPGPTAPPTPDPQVVAGCKKAVADLGAGNVKAAIESFPAAKRAALIEHATLVNAVTCLAMTGADSHYCELLPAQWKTNCEARVDRASLVRDLKNAPKKDMKSLVIYHTCLANIAKPECDKFKQAMDSRNASPCSAITNASYRAFCAAIATSDAAKCKDVSPPAHRDACAAYATNDASRCSEEAGSDCPKLAGGFAAFEKSGFAAFEQIDPIVFAANRDGKKGCTAMLEALEAQCLAD